VKGFREFLLRGNVIDLAVAVVIGTAFTALVTAVVTNIFQPIIGALFNAKSLDGALIVSIPLTAGTADVRFGAVLGAIINFVIIAAVVYFAFVLPINALLKRAFQRPAEPVSDTPAPPTELDLLAQIRDLLQGQDKVGDKRILNQD
jgi:large conductance mechanosensitive channel